MPVIDIVLDEEKEHSIYTVLCNGQQMVILHTCTDSALSSSVRIDMNPLITSHTKINSAEQ